MVNKGIRVYGEEWRPVYFFAEGDRRDTSLITIDPITEKRWRRIFRGFKEMQEALSHLVGHGHPGPPPEDDAALYNLFKRNP